MPTDPPRIAVNDAVDLVKRALIASGVAEDAASSTADALVAAEVDGQTGHGFSRVASYAAQARIGKVDGAARPTVTPLADALLQVDAAHGFAFPAIDLAIAALPALAAKTGVAAAGIVRSHHCGQLGAHVERLAERGVAALMVANAPKAIAPWGGAAPFFGTNPIAFAAPMADGSPLVIDLSLSKVARGKVMAAAKEGKPIPEGWALDADGRPTTDAAAALEGTMLPAGDAKGAALALMVEVLAATLIGATPSHEATSFLNTEGGPPNVGQLIIALHPGRAAGDDSFAARLSALAADMTAQDGARLPGTRRLAARAEARSKGVLISDRLRSEIETIAQGA